MKKGYHIHGKIGQMTKISGLKVGELFCDYHEQCPYLLDKIDGEDYHATPLMPVGEPSIYNEDHDVRAFTLLKERVLIETPPKASKQ